MPFPVRFAAIVALVLWVYMLGVAPASAPVFHPAGLLDWSCVLSFLAIGPMMAVAAFIPTRYLGGY